MTFPPDNPPALDDGVPVGQPDQALDVLVDDQRGLTRLAQSREAQPDLLAHQRRQSLGGLVENQQARVGQQRTADRQHLLLAAGQLVAHVLLPLGEAGKA